MDVGPVSRYGAGRCASCCRLSPCPVVAHPIPAVDPAALEVVEALETTLLVDARSARLDGTVALLRPELSLERPPCSAVGTASLETQIGVPDGDHETPFTTSENSPSLARRPPFVSSFASALSNLTEPNLIPNLTGAGTCGTSRGTAGLCGKH